MLVLLDALLDVLALLLELELLVVVLDDFAHAVHDGLDASSALRHRRLSRLLLLKSHLHVGFDLLSVLLLDLLEFSKALAFLVHVLLDHFHCSLTLLDFLGLFSSSLILDFCSKLCHSAFLFSLTLQLFFDLLLFRLLKHEVAHLLLLDDFRLNLRLLFALLVHFLLSLIEDATIKVLLFLLSFFPKLRSQLNLLVQHFSHLLNSIFVLNLLPSLLFLMELLTEFLDLAPLVVADVRRHVFDLNNSVVARDPSLLGDSAHLGGASRTYWLRTSNRCIFPFAEDFVHVDQVSLSSRGPL